MTIDVFATGLQMGESPRWHQGSLWVCDWLGEQVLRFNADGRSEVVARVPGLPVSIDWLPDGELVVACAQGVLAGTELRPYGASGLPWNEIVVSAAGDVYVNMPGSRPNEEPRPGHVGVVRGDGSFAMVAEGLAFPNGMAITTDNTLLVAESHGHRITAYVIADDGSLGHGEVWADLGEAAAPDGVCLDAEGALWYADVPNQHCRRVAAGGQVLQTVDVGQGCFACMLGGDDGRTLFIVANDWDGSGAANGRILQTRVEVPHAGRP